MVTNPPPTPTFSTQLQRKGFQIYYSLDSTGYEQSVVFGLIAAGLLLHTSKDYGDFSEYFRSIRSQRLPVLSALGMSSEVSLLSASLLHDLNTYFQSRPWSYLFQDQVLPPKHNAQIWNEIADCCMMHLTWYESTSTGVITHTYAGSEEWKVFVTLAEERPKMYLLVLREFEGVPGKGFPFYSNDVRGLESMSIGRENDAVDTSELTTYKKLAGLQSDLINNLLSIVTHIGTTPPSISSKLDAIRDIHTRIQSLPHNIDSQSIHRILNSPHPPVSSQSVHPASNTCVCCNTPWSPSLLWKSDHGCAFCYQCCIRQKNRTDCLHCHRGISSEDQKKLRLFATISLDRGS